MDVLKDISYMIANVYHVIQAVVIVVYTLIHVLLVNQDFSYKTKNVFILAKMEPSPIQSKAFV